MKFVPGLAKSWHCSDDKLSWTFQIDPGRQFSSGNEVTAEDVVFSLQRIFMLEKAPSVILAPLGLSLGNVKKVVTASQKDQVVITLPPGASARLLQHFLTSSVCSIIDKKVVQSHHATDPIWAAAAALSPDTIGNAGIFDHGESWLRFNSAGSGPFQATNVSRTDEILLERNKRPRSRTIAVFVQG
jgi:peptide/nickel transport system substrate-binding protein